MVYTVLGICIALLVAMTLAAFWFKSDAAFWEIAYRTVNKACNEVHEKNGELLEMCARDLDFAKETLEDNRKLLDIMTEMKNELEEIKETKEEES